MAARLRLARAQRVSDDKLARVARTGLAPGDPDRARRAADIWLTFRAADAPGDSPGA